MEERRYGRDGRKDDFYNTLRSLEKESMKPVIDAQGFEGLRHVYGGKFKQVRELFSDEEYEYVRLRFETAQLLFLQRGGLQNETGN